MSWLFSMQFWPLAACNILYFLKLKINQILISGCFQSLLMLFRGSSVSFICAVTAGSLTKQTIILKKDKKKTKNRVKAFFTADILTCYNKKNTNVTCRTVAQFYATVQRRRQLNGNGALINFTIYTCAFSTVTCQNVCSEKSPIKAVIFFSKSLFSLVFGFEL